jgi:hypothetical protein
VPAALRQVVGVDRKKETRMMTMEPKLDIGILADRMQRLARLDTTIFEEVRQDASATLPAILVLAVSTFLAGIGGWLWWMIHDFGDYEGGTRIFFESVLVGSFFSVVLWLLWLGVSWVVLTQIFREEARWQEMLRTMGMASAPLAISFAMFIPGLDMGIALASIALFFSLTTMAIQAVTTANAARVLTANVAGFTVWAVLLGLFATSESMLAPGIFLFDSASEALSDIFSIS